MKTKYSGHLENNINLSKQMLKIQNKIKFTRKNDNQRQLGELKTNTQPQHELKAKLKEEEK